MPGALRVRNLLPFARRRAYGLPPSLSPAPPARRPPRPSARPTAPSSSAWRSTTARSNSTCGPSRRSRRPSAEFHRTGQNPYRGDAKAIAAGKAVWQKWCRACHLDDGTGRIGPNLVDDKVHHGRVATDVGTFEVIYAGGAGAMQAFGKRVDQDTILAVMAYLVELQEAAGN